MRNDLLQSETKEAKIRVRTRKAILYIKESVKSAGDNQPNIKPTNYSELFPVHITNLKMSANSLPVPFLFLHTMDPRDNDV